MCTAAYWCLQHTAMSKERPGLSGNRVGRRRENTATSPARQVPDQSQAVMLSSLQVMGTLG